MTTEDNTKQDYRQAREEVSVPKELLAFLCNERRSANRERYSRTKAFLYLFSSLENKANDNLEATDLSNYTHVLRVTITKLRKVWRWSYPTVKSFLVTLQKLGIIEVKSGKRTLKIKVPFTINADTLQSLNHDPVAVHDGTGKTSPTGSR